MGPSRIVAVASLLALLAAISCAGSGEAPAPRRTGEAVPTGRLPEDVRPIRYELALEIQPKLEAFTGAARIEIELDRAKGSIWLHGLGLEVADATVEPAFGEKLPARWEPVDASGVAALRFPQPVGPGTATLRISYRALFDERLRGLYRVEAGGDAYAFTQFEPTKARRAFPGFDQPSFKTPFDVTLVVAAGDTAVANTPPLESRKIDGGRRQIRFATTQPLPTYLLAWAVGPFDVAEGPSLGSAPFRGLAARGRGGELRYALDHTPALLAALEAYFGTPYPYAKLDVISVPDFGSGAMENAGAITFRDSLLLLDPDTAPEWQRRAFSYVMAHELAHQWFGNLVTMEWWDDLWLNEAFATWMGRRVVQAVAPEQESDLALLQNVHQAMDADSQVSARRIRQPIESHHDIENAFDGITYSKGAGVLSMFEHWLGDASFQRGVRRYLDRHRLGTATEADLLRALSEASARNVATPFRTFLTQPGVPLLEIATECNEGAGALRVRQSRYLPIGSEGDRNTVWQIPVCARYGSPGGGEGWREQCSLVTGVEGRIALEGGCPDWVMPNSSATGYYRWALSAGDHRRLLDRGWKQLSARERLSVAMNLGAAFRAGELDSAAVFGSFVPLVGDPNRLVAEAPMSLIHRARENLVGAAKRPAVEAFARKLYAPRLVELGWDPRADEDGETKLWRRSLLHFLAFTGRDPEVRAEARRRARVHVGLEPADTRLDPELVDTALAVAVQDGDRDVFDALHSRLATERDAIERARILRALGFAQDPTLADRARSLAFDPTLRTNEVLTTLWTQSNRQKTRRANWNWIRSHFDALVDRAGPEHASRLPWMTSGFCTASDATEVESFLDTRVEALPGGPRNLAGALEAIHLCTALTEEQAPSATKFFSN